MDMRSSLPTSPSGRPRFPTGIAYGWYFVSYADELACGDVRPVRYFGRDLVLFRNEAGEAGLLDAYCPHLGAHIGHGGTVDGVSVRCPFHAWAFRPDGFCSDIPYARTMPPVARKRAILRSYPVVEANGVVWAWYHPLGDAPSFDVEVYAEFGADDWSAPIRREWRFASTPQEISENGVDVAHLKYVHGLTSVPEGETRYEGQVRRSLTRGERQVSLADGTSATIATSAETIQNGAGQKVIRLKDLVDLTMMALVTPVERDQVEMRYCFTHRKVAAGSAQEVAALAIIAGTCGRTGVEGDIPIWSNKIYRPTPLLCDGDGQILRFRRYFQQFYVSLADPHDHDIINDPVAMRA